MDEEYIRLLYQTSPLHDLGKVGIPDAILLKPGKLTADEFTVMKTHTVVGAETLDAALARFPNARFLQMAREIAADATMRSSTARVSARAWPASRSRCAARIVAVADVYDALTSRRVYKEAMPHEQAKAIILRDRGSHFDPEVVDAFLRAEAADAGGTRAIGGSMPASPTVTRSSRCPAAPGKTGPALHNSRRRR